MIACRASLRDARRKINFRIAGRNDRQSPAAVDPLFDI
jgi:hypothetical protein